MPINKKQISMFHTAKAQVGMTADEKEALLSGLGVTSTKELTQDMFDQAILHFERMGFTHTNKFYRPAGSKKRLISKIVAIREDIGVKDSYIDAIAQNMFKNKKGTPIGSYRWCTAQQLHKLVAALSYHQNRQKKASR